MFSAMNIRLSKIDIALCPTTFEFLCFRTTSKSSSCLSLLIYRTGAIPALFFEEIADVLDKVMTFSDTVFITGDFNIHIERPEDPHGRKLMNLMSTYGMVSLVNCPTHILGGTLDLLFSNDVSQVSVTVSNPAISDHFLLSWNSSLSLPRLIYSDVTFRPWRSLDITTFRDCISHSPLCNPDNWSSLDVDALSLLYDQSIIEILDSLIPLKTS